MRCLYSWIKDFVPSLKVSVDEFASVLTMKGLEVEEIEKVSGDDWALEISITPNRPDWLSMLGIAREVSAVYGWELTRPEIHVEENVNEKGLVPIEITVPDLCPRYTAAVIKGVKTGPSPSWLSERLESCGIRSINNIVDITNYVLLETGQPLHAFDLKKLNGPEIIVRNAKEGEKIVTIDGKERTLKSSMLVIADSKSPVAVAGVMGGYGSEVSAGTKDILLESAWFAPSQVRRTAKTLKLPTDSSYRFERGVDPENVLLALNRAKDLILEFSGGELITPVVDLYPRPYEPYSISLRMERLQRILGVKISLEETLKIMERLGLSPQLNDPFSIKVAIPSFRLDILEEIDLIEEVVRLFGYENIPAKTPEGVISKYACNAYLTERGEFTNRVKRLLKGQGVTEIISYSFFSPDDINALGFDDTDPRMRMVSLQNPLSTDQTVMRTSLVPSLLKAISSNQAHRNMDLKLFETGQTFQQGEGDLPCEEQRIVCGLTGLKYEEAWNLPQDKIDIFDIKGLIEEMLSSLFIQGWRVTVDEERTEPFYRPFNCSRLLTAENIDVGTFGEVEKGVLDFFDINGPVFIFDLSMDKLLSSQKVLPKFIPLPKYPAIERDIAIILSDNVHAKEFQDFIWGLKPSYLESLKIFDLYKGKSIPKGKKSMGLRFSYRSIDHTLSENEITPVHESLVETMLDKYNASLRS